MVLLAAVLGTCSTPAPAPEKAGSVGSEVESDRTDTAGGERAGEESAVGDPRREEGLKGGAEAAVGPEASEAVEASRSPEGDADVEGASGVRRGASRPRTVDLSRLPSEQSEAMEPREAPAPGLPNPEAKLQQEMKLDLGRRLAIDVSVIGVVSSEKTTWSDASLGCPEPGRMYAQARTPGYRVVLRAGDDEYAYHSRGTSAFILCE
jgi:hypothetical protein